MAELDSQTLFALKMLAISRTPDDLDRIADWFRQEAQNRRVQRVDRILGNQTHQESLIDGDDQ
jgi:hypothetical protein